MKKGKKSTGALIIASAIVWGAVMIGCASALKGTECYHEIQLILAGGVLAHLLLVWTPAAIIMKKNAESSDDI